MLDKLDNFLIKLELLFCEVLLVILVSVVFLNAVLRLFDSPLNWSNDIAQLIFIWISMVGADLALKKDRHSGVDVITRKFSDGVQKALSIATYVAILVFLIVIARSSTNLAIMNYSRKFNSLPLSYSFVTLAVPVGCVLLGFTCIRKLMIILGKKENFYADKLNDPEPTEEDEFV